MNNETKETKRDIDAELAELYLYSLERMYEGLDKGENRHKTYQKVCGVWVHSKKITEDGHVVYKYAERTAGGDFAIIDRNRALAKAKYRAAAHRAIMENDRTKYSVRYKLIGEEIEDAIRIGTVAAFDNIVRIYRWLYPPTKHHIIEHDTIEP